MARQSKSYLTEAKAKPSTGKKIASDSAKMLRDPKAAKKEKELAGSDLTQSRKIRFKGKWTLASKRPADLKETSEIISRICEWAGGEDQARAWYRSQPISAFGDQTAEAMVKAGKASLVLDYLDGIAVGGFA